MMDMAMTIIVRDIMIELVITKSKIDLHKGFIFLDLLWGGTRMNNDVKAKPLLIFCTFYEQAST